MENSTILESKNTWTIFWFQEVPFKTLSAVFSLFPEKNGLRRISHRIYYLLMGCSWSVEAGRTQQLLMIPGHTSTCTVGVAAAVVACCWWVFWTVPCAAAATRGFHRKELFCFLSQAFGQCREREREIGDIRTLNQEVFFGGFLSDWVDPLKCTVQAHGPLVKTSFKTPSLICRPSLEIQCR